MEPVFSRINRFCDEVGELRVNLAKFKLAVLDSVAISETRATGNLISRTDLIDRILTEFISKKIDESNLIQTILKDYPTVLEKESDE
jgi:hypothetical protein